MRLLAPWTSACCCCCCCCSCFLPAAAAAAAAAAGVVVGVVAVAAAAAAAVELITSRTQGPNLTTVGSKSILLLTGAVFERGRKHEIKTRAPFLKISAIKCHLKFASGGSKCCKYRSKLTSNVPNTL